VVEKGKDGTVTVILADKISYTATIVGNDPNTDIAVIKIKPAKDEVLTVAKLGDSSNLDIADWAIAIGNPFGDAGLDRTVTVGVISAIGRANLNFGEGSPQYQDYIQTDAAINPGNSGGPLINMKGEVIGVNAAITSTSGGNIGIGFAIPINLAKRVVDDLVSSGKVVRAYMGITPQEITGDMMESLNLKEVAGVLVSKVEKDSPADKAGIRKGDVIMDFNGEKVPNVSKFRIVVATAKIGVNTPVRLLRDEKEVVLNVKLDPYPEDIAAAGKEKDTKSTMASGITVEANDSQFAKRMNVNTDKGVVVSKIDADSPAAKSDLQVGNVILEIERTEINNPADFYKELNAAKDRMDKGGKKALLLYVQDNNKAFRYVILKFE
jgi:serine protease Do